MSMKCHKKITLFRPFVSWLARFYALKVLCGTQLAEGPVVRQFELEFAKYIGKGWSRVVSLNSGTTALELAYELAGIGPGDEVITPVLTCTATNLPLVRRGAKIVFADIDDTLNISIHDVEKKITPRTKAIVFVHFGGNSSGLRQLLVLARRHNIRVIEDAAQSVGADPQTWCLADFTCVSLQAIKTLTAGDGGFLICNNLADAQKARRLRWFGYDRPLKQQRGDTDLIEAGYKYHMNDISAAIGLGNLRRIDTVLRKRDRIRSLYIHGIQKRNLYGRFYFHPWLLVLIHPQSGGVRWHLNRKGIECGPYHYRNDKYSIFGGTRYPDAEHGIFPNMDRLELQYQLLPFHHGMTKHDVDRVLDAIKEFEVWDR